MQTVEEKPINTIESAKIRHNALRQGKKINLSLFNYCFLTYFHLTREIKKYARYAKGIVLDVGCGSSPFKGYFDKYAEEYLKHEHPDAAKEGVKYDVLSELPKIDVKDKSIDTIICISVLEHVSEPIETIKEFHRILRDEGIIIISVPQYWHLHEEPHDYYRFTKHLLNKKMPELGFDIIHIKETGKSFAVVGQVLCNSLILLFDLNHVKNIFSLLSGERPKNIGKSLTYMLYKSPLIVLTVFLIPIINFVCLLLDKVAGSKRDTIGYFVLAIKKTEN